MSSSSKPVPPGAPPPSPPPGGPTHPTPTGPPKRAAVDDLLAVAEAVGVAPSRRCEEPGGAAQPPAPAGKEPAPGSAVALSGATRESTSMAAGAGVVPPLGVGRTSGLDLVAPGRVGSGGGTDLAPAADASFSLPPIPTVPRFDNGPRCCVGKSLNDGVAASCGRTVTHYPHRLDRAPGAL